MPVSTTELFKEAQQILAKVLKISPDEVKPDSLLRDELGIDSVDFWDVIACFDKKYKVRISEKEAEALKSVSDIVAALEAKIGGKR